MILRRMKWAALAVSAAAYAACAPIPQVVDTPTPGQQVALNVNQPMQVRWSNADPKVGGWVVEAEPGVGAVTLVKRTQQPPAGGAMGLDVFEFVGAKAGSEKLTFAYRRNNGEPTDPNERITIQVNVG